MLYITIRVNQKTNVITIRMIEDKNNIDIYIRVLRDGTFSAYILNQQKLWIMNDSNGVK